MPSVVFEDYKVIDVDTHVSEPEDLWTSRVSVKKWGDMVPHVVPYEEAMERAGSRGGLPPGRACLDRWRGAVLGCRAGRIHRFQ